MIALRKALHSMNPRYFGTAREVIEAGRSKRREFLVVACCDYVPAPNDVSFASKEQFVVIQNMAASVPPAVSGVDPTTIASVEFALTVAKVRHLIVLGHARCNILQHWVEQPLPDFVPDPLGFRADAGAVVAACYPDATPRERIDLAIREHIVFQLENLQSHDCVRSRLKAGLLRLHGWLVDERTARVRAFNPMSGQFSIL